VDVVSRFLDVVSELVDAGPVVRSGDMRPVAPAARETSMKLRSSAALPTVLLASVLVACSGSNDQSSGGDSGSAVSDATTPLPDAPSGDAGTDADAAPTPAEDGDVADGSLPDVVAPGDGGATSEDAELADAVAADAGPPVVSAANLVGWTQDERLVYQTNDGIYALARDGGVDTVATPAAGDAGLSGAIGTLGVFVTQGTTLGAWTATTGYHALSTDLSANVPPLQSPDGTKALYFQSIDGGSEAVLENIDGTSAHTLSFTPVSGFWVMNQEAFTATDGVATAAYVPLTATTATAGLDLFIGDPPTNVGIFAMGPTGNATLITTATGVGSAVLDTGVTSGIFDATGANVYYLSGTSLKTLAVASPGTTSTLVTGGVTAPLAVSPDGRFVAYASATDYYVVPTSGAGTPASFGATPQGAQAFFTPDSSYVVSLAGYDGTQGAYDLVAQSVAPGGETTTWSGIYFSVPMFDTRLLMLNAAGDLFLADVSGKLPLRLIATNVYAFAESWDNAQIAWQLEGATGVYLTAAK
jgi:hypothetical protein